MLEGFLRKRLFRRDRHGISLTPEGRAYHAEVAPAFLRIAAATRRLLAAADLRPIRLRSYSTFATRWLLPRLPRFQEAHPGLEVVLSTGVAPIDFSREEADLAIQFGAGGWPGLDQRRLMGDVIQPVCSPRLLRRRNAPRQLADLARCTLLHTKYRRNDWQDWLAAMGGPVESAATGMVLPGSVLAYQAAMEGLGIAMGQLPMLRQELSAGILVPLFEPLARPLAHYAVWPARQPPDHRLRAFLDWLEREAASG